MPLQTVIFRAIAGKPIIATALAATPEIVIHNVTGILVKAEDDDAVAKAIIRLHQDEPFYKKRGYCQLLLATRGRRLSD